MDSEKVIALLSTGGGSGLNAEDAEKSLEARKAKMKEFLSSIGERKSQSKNVHFHLVEVDIVDALTMEKLCTLERVANASSMSAVKELFERKFPQYYTSRQSFSLRPYSRSLRDSATLADLNLSNECTIYFRDLGPQMTWYSVFYFQYAASLLSYLFFYIRPPYVYDDEYTFAPSSELVVHIAALCHTLHYARRLMETRFVHRLSTGTTPVASLLKNSCFHWGFSVWMAYFVNHPLYTPPMFGDTQTQVGLWIFLFNEIGNCSIHFALRKFKGDEERRSKAPRPTTNPFTWLFALVSCPDYLYETGSWVGFMFLTQTFPALLFTIIGFSQMTVWALNNHRAYVEEFPDYPSNKKAIFPFVI